MILRSILLQHFRNYTQEKFDFSETLTLIIGVNTAGKTNLSEAIYLLATGKSFKAGNDTFMIAFGQEIARVGGLLEDVIPDQIGDPGKELDSRFRGNDSKKKDDGLDKTKIEVVIASPQATGGRFSKKFLINGVGKSRNSLRGMLPIVLFRPEELDIIIDGPSLRRAFLNEVLEQADKEYAQALSVFERSLRQRNALLRIAQETGKRNSEQFDYWDELLIESGQTITQKREEFLVFINSSTHDIFPLQTFFDKSIISRERLDGYEMAEVGAGVTLVGPHRDDFFVNMEYPGFNPNPHPSSPRQADLLPKGEGEQGDIHYVDIRFFGSRGQQRLAVLQLKMLQIQYLEKKLGVLPLLILDDIFSELDSNHIQLVLDNVKGCQIILTTTHREFIPQKVLREASVVELER